MPDELAMDSGALIFATLADVYLSSGMIDEAISILKDGLLRNPTYTLAKVILGRAYYAKGDIEEATKILEEAYSEVKESESTNLYLAHCYKKRGEDDKAVELYEATLKINPKNSEAEQELRALRPEPVAEKVEPLPESPVETEEERVIPTVEVEEEKIEAVAEPLTKEEEVVVEPVAEPAPKEEERVIPTVEVEEEKIEAVAEPFVKAEEEEVKSVLEPPVKEEHVEPVAVPVGEAEEAVEKVHEPMLVEEEKPTELDIQPQEPQEVTTVSVPFESLDKPMSRLLGIKTVKGAFICSNDGLLIQDYCKARADTEEMCAMIAAIYNEAEQSFKFLKEGGVEKFIIEKGDETICVITAGESLLTVITHPETKAGLVFVYARKIIDEIREILG